ncbi:MAG: EF-hand domain-containing protein, partial [Planctomycetaceae bacterium]
MKISTSLLATLAFAAAAAPGFAQDAPEGGRGAGRQRMVAPLMQALDADQDGSLSPAEIENAAKALAKLDKNGDGTISTDELRPAGLPEGLGRQP